MVELKLGTLEKDALIVSYEKDVLEANKERQTIIDEMIKEILSAIEGEKGK
ncbi:MAG: hypothetical protein FWE02_04665 [Defluviitaleaceae bacterium]|nr:hypothetical protein [Defluviitaleaceae bacterium]